MPEYADWKKELESYLTPGIRALVEHVDGRLPLEELRVRAMQPVQLIFSGWERLISGPGGRPAAQMEDMAEILSSICEHSVYAYETELNQGWVTLRGGCRAGLAGRCIVENGRLHHIEEVTSVCFRISRQWLGVSDALIPQLSRDGRMLSTLVLSPPGCGKTTLLRDLTRNASTGGAGILPCRVSVADTRYEIAGCSRGAAVFDLGPRTDVLSGGSRAECILRLVNSMSPQLLVTDEISSMADAKAVLEAAACGVTVLASAHGERLRELFCRDALRELLGAKVFQRYIFLGRSRGTGTVETILDEGGARIPVRGNQCLRQLHS